MEFNIFPSEAGVYLFSGIHRFNGTNPDTLPSDIIGIISNTNINVFSFADGSYRFINRDGGGIAWFGVFNKLDIPPYAHSLPSSNQDPLAYREFVNTMRSEIKKLSSNLL